MRIAAAKPSASRREAAATIDYFYFWVSVREDGVTITGLYDNDYYNDYQPFTTLFFDGQTRHPGRRVRTLQLGSN